MNLNLTDKTPVVSGSTKDIGFAIATGLAREGARLTGVRPMIEKYPLSGAAEAYQRHGGKVLFRVIPTMA